MNTIISFIKYYVISMRLHFGFITGTSGLIGIMYYEHLYPGSVSIALKLFFIFTIFLSYGINQIINDYFGMPEDRINAPNRPMVSGKLHPLSALITSISLMILVGIASFIISPWSVIPLFAGVILNIIYEYAKSVSLLGNIIFGLSISMCPVYGYFIAGTNIEYHRILPAVAILILLIIGNAIMTYFTYFKDYEGDLKTGKKTFVVKHGKEKARIYGILFSCIPLLLVAIFILFGIFKKTDIDNHAIFWSCFIITTFLRFKTSLLYYRSPDGDSTYYNLKTNIQTCVALNITIIAMYNGRLAIILFPLCYILVKIIFNMHRDTKA